MADAKTPLELLNDPTIANNAGNFNNPKNNPIPARDIVATNPVIIPPPIQDSTNYAGITTGIGTTTQSSQDAELARQTALQDNAQKDSKNTQDSILALMGVENNKASDTQNALDTAGATELSRKLNDLNSQIQNVNLEAQTANQTLESQAGGKDVTTAFLGRQQQEVNRQAAIKSLTLNSQYNILKGNYDTAKENAQRAIDLKYLPIENELKMRQQQYEFNKENLMAIDKKRTEALNISLKKQEQDLADKKATEGKIQDIKLEIAKNGAPDSVLKEMDSVSSIGDAIGLASGYLKDPLDIELKKAQINKAWNDARKTDTSSGVLTEQQLKQIDTSPQGKKLSSLSGLYQKMQTYKNLVDSFGFKASGKEKGLIDSAYADLKISWKEAANLGALTGPDVAIIEEAVKPSSGGAINYLNYKLSGGKGGISSAIENSLKTSKKEAINNYKQLITRNPQYAGSEYVRGLIIPFAKDYSTIDVDNLSAGEIIQTEDGILLESLGGGKYTPL
jgi:hypothetical protein